MVVISRTGLERKREREKYHGVSFPLARLVAKKEIACDEHSPRNYAVCCVTRDTLVAKRRNKPIMVELQFERCVRDTSGGLHVHARTLHAHDR
jgi:hypothetical protein